MKKFNKLSAVIVCVILCVSLLCGATGVFAQDETDTATTTSAAAGESETTESGLCDCTTEEFNYPGNYDPDNTTTRPGIGDMMDDDMKEDLSEVGDDIRDTASGLGKILERIYDFFEALKQSLTNLMNLWADAIKK